MATKKHRYSISLSNQGDVFLKRLMKDYGTCSVSLAVEILLTSYESYKVLNQCIDFSELNDSASLLAPRSVSLSASSKED